MSVRSLVAAALVAVAVTGTPAASQERASDEMTPEQARMMEAYTRAGTPGEMHRVLAKTAGTWSAEVRMWMEAGAEPTVSRATSVIEPVMDGRFLREAVEGEFMGAPFHGVSLIGYNNVTGKVQGVWYDNHSTALYVYEGRLSSDGTLDMRSGHHDPATGQWIETVSRREVEGSDRMVDTGWEIRDGEKVKTMEIVYRRRN